MDRQRREWVAEVHGRGVLAVGTSLGLDALPGRSLGPCPACGARTRHPRRRDQRGALGARPDGRGWRCFECDASGDAVTLAAWLVCGKGSPDPGGWREVHHACSAQGLCVPPDGEPGGPQRMRRVVVPAGSPSPPPPLRPPQGEVAEVWERARPVFDDAEARAWLEQARGLDAAQVTDFDLARVLPRGVQTPAWAYFGRRSWSLSHRLLVPLFGSAGRLESLHARALGCAADGPKAVSPRGCSTCGLVMADSLGQLLLARRPLASGTPPCRKVVRVGLVLTEGVPDFLTVATHASDANEDAPAVMGIVSGSWTKAMAAQVPDGATLVIATHVDAAGEKYARRIQKSLHARQLQGTVRLRRWRPTQHSEVA